MTSNKSNSLNTNQVQNLEVSEQFAGQRLDNFLLTRLKGVPKSHIYRIIRKGEVRINKKRCKPLQKLAQGDVVRIPPIRLSDASSAPDPSKAALETLEKSIIFEDKDLLIINKPSGFAVHGGSGVSYGVIEGFRVLRPRERRLELVHRLDRDTSGCLIMAKKTSVLRAFHEMIRNDEMEKYYLALLKGVMPDDEILVDQPLRKFVTKSGERMVKIDKEGKASQTIFTVSRRFKNATLVDVKLLTGRTHQIRVHSLYLDQPIAGDDKYGDEDFNKQMQTVGLKRLFLHAKRLKFRHPVSGELMEPVAGLDKELTEVISKLGNES
ncbi:MAG: 23S rRNA pseudouridine(955/2504/2580) synthase RluC [Gammaproteobacteria bacterium]|nr:23S rRNA pseudouridine(955/2504/2580) synthase RluC [Gammaproteobacteria bacterium]